jgi:hypothetical protein
MEQTGLKPSAIDGSPEAPFCSLPENEFQSEEIEATEVISPVEVNLTDYLHSAYLIDKSPASLQRHEGLKLLRLQVLNGVEKPYATSKNRFSGWDDQRCLKYGEFLIDLISPETINHKYITHAARAGIGPGVGGIERRFGSLAVFYSELGVAKDNPRNHFDDWSIGHYLEYIQGIARLNDGLVSEAIIRRHYNAAKEAGANLPSPSVIKTATGQKIGELIEMAGFKVPTRPKSEYDCAHAAVDFRESHGRWPNSRDLTPENNMPSWPTVRKYCGSMNGFLSLAQKELDELAAESYELAA